MNDKDYILYTILKDNGFIIPPEFKKKYEEVKEVKENDEEKVSKIPTVGI